MSSLCTRKILNLVSVFSFKSWKPKFYSEYWQKKLLGQGVCGGGVGRGRGGGCETLSLTKATNQIFLSLALFLLLYLLKSSS